MKGYSFHVLRHIRGNTRGGPTWDFMAILMDPPLLTDPEFVTQGWRAAVPRPYPGFSEAGSLAIVFRSVEGANRVSGSIRTVAQHELPEWKRIGEKDARARFPTAFEHWNDMNVLGHVHIKPREAYDHVKVDRARLRQRRTDVPNWAAAIGRHAERTPFAIRSYLNRWTRFNPNVYTAAVESARAEVTWLWNLSSLTSTEVNQWDPHLLKRYEDLLYHGVPEMAVLRYREMLWQNQWAGGEAYPWMYDWWMKHHCSQPEGQPAARPPTERQNRFLSIGEQSNGPPTKTKS